MLQAYRHKIIFLKPKVSPPISDKAQYTFLSSLSKGDTGKMLVPAEGWLFAKYAEIR